MSITIVPAARTYPTLRKDLEAARLALAFQQARVDAYVKSPALDSDGGPLPLPLRFRIALRTATKRHAAALTAYNARYGR